MESKNPSQASLEERAELQRKRDQAIAERDAALAEARKAGRPDGTTDEEGPEEINDVTSEEPKVPARKGNKFTKEDFEHEINASIQEFDISGLLPPTFNELELGQRYKVIEDLKKRVVDIVKSEAKSRYELDVAKSRKVAKVGKALTEASSLRKLEKEELTKLKSTPEGKAKISRSLNTLIENAKKNKAALLENGNVEVIYINPEDMAYLSPEEKSDIDNFNFAAAKFSKIPYEWGQEKSGRNKRDYDTAKRNYERARENVLAIKAKKEDRAKAIASVLEIDNSLKMEQLLNAHPDFQKELIHIARDSKVVDLRSNWQSLLEKASGKGYSNLSAGLAGFGARIAARGAALFSGATVITFVAAPIIGAAIGAYKGKIRGETTLEERQKEARRGKKDTSKEATNTVSAENLNERLATMLSAYERATTEEEKEKRLDQLKRRIKYTQDKIEGGLVNFGDVNSSLNNQFNLINNLNQGIVASSSQEETVRKDIDTRLAKLLAKRKGKINAAQSEYIRGQIKQSAKYGAMFALGGYGLKYVLEWTGVWGKASLFNEKVADQATPQAGQNVPPPGGQPNEVSGPQSKVPPQQSTGPGSPQDSPAQPGATDASKAPGAKPPIEGQSDASTKTPDATSTEASKEGKGLESTVTFEKGKGGIEGVINLREQLRAKYPDVSKAPQAVQDFLKHPSATKLAIELGFYDPANPNESALIMEGSSLRYDEATGKIVFHDARTGKDIEKYSGRMFDSDGSGKKVAPSVEAPAEEKNIFADNFAPKKPEGPFSNIKFTDSKIEFEEIPKLSPEEEAAYRAQREALLERGRMAQENLPKRGVPHEPDRAGHYQPYRPPQFIPGNEGGGYTRPYNQPFGGYENAIKVFPDLTEGENRMLQSNPEFLDNPYKLKGRLLIESYKVHQNNVNIMFPNEKEAVFWESFKENKAGSIFEDKNGPREAAVGSPFGKVYAHMQRLYQVTGEKPKGKNLLRWKSETIEEYIARATQKAAKMGRLDAITAKLNK